MTKTALKKQIRRKLISDDWDQFPVLFSKHPQKTLITCLFGIIKQPDLISRHRAAFFLGSLMADFAQTDLEGAREFMRRLIWSLNEESGGIGWGTAEALGEISAQSLKLGREFGKFLISYLASAGNYLEFLPLQRSVVWGLGRFAQKQSKLVQKQCAVPCLVNLLESEDSELRGLSAWALGWLQQKSVIPDLKKLAQDNAKITIWENNRLITKPILSWAQNAILRIDS